MINSNNTFSDPYVSYIYSYPHKLSYRDFDKPINLNDLWANSRGENITLYIHIPFCISKCGYCNLMSSTSYDNALLDSYVDKVIEEIKTIPSYLDLDKDISPFESVIFGGGTPTLIGYDRLQRILITLKEHLGICFDSTFLSIESSPRTLTTPITELLESYGINRISMGIQSFDESELRILNRPEGLDYISKGLDLLFSRPIPIRNIDLIYGIPGQTEDSFMYSLERAMLYKPEEVFIYPMYVRERTPLYGKVTLDKKLMHRLYSMAVKYLNKCGYIQTSMRCFIREDKKSDLYPQYNCQESEMIGLGCGARSYISNIHYSNRYAVEQANIRDIIRDYLRCSDTNLACYGFTLNKDELQRRYILKSILKVTGLDIKEYSDRFDSNPLDDFGDIGMLIKDGYLMNDGTRIIPTTLGLSYSDAMGNLFISQDVREKTKSFEER